MKIFWLILSLTALFLGSGCQHAAIPSLAMQEKFFNTVKASNPEQEKALRRAQYHTLVGRFDLALKELTHAVASDPHNIRLLNALGNCYDKLGQYTKAQENYEQVLAQDAENLSAQNNLAYSLYLSGDLTRSEKNFQEILAKNPEYTVASNNLGLVWCRQGKESQALSLWKKTDGEIQAREKLNQILAFLGKPAEKSAFGTAQEPDKNSMLPADPKKEEKGKTKSQSSEVACYEETPVINRSSNRLVEKPKPASANTMKQPGMPASSPQSGQVKVEEVKMIIQPASYSPPPNGVDSLAQDLSTSLAPPADLAKPSSLYSTNHPERKEVSHNKNLSQFEVDAPGAQNYYRPRQWKRSWKPKIVTLIPQEPHNTAKPIKNAITRESIYQNQSASDKRLPTIY